MTQTAQRIMANDFGRALAAAGVIGDLDKVRRVVIDAEAGEVLRVYVEYFGDERWLNVAQALDGIEVTTSPQEPA